MRRMTILLVVGLQMQARAQDVSSIIDRIQTEQQAPAVPSAPPRKAKPEKKPNKAQERPAPSVQFWGPKDKLPQDIAGQLLIGDFKAIGASINGHPLLVAEDGLFGRSFEVDNLSTGLAPGQSYPTGQEPRMRFTRNDPLVFIERGMLGCYTVRATRPVRSQQVPPVYGGYYNQGQSYTTPTYRSGWGVSPN